MRLGYVLLREADLLFQSSRTRTQSLEVKVYHPGQLVKIPLGTNLLDYLLTQLCEILSAGSPLLVLLLIDLPLVRIKLLR